MGETAITKFMESVRVDAGSGCWLWSGPRHTLGYAMFCVPGSGKMVMARRWIYSESNGHIRGRKLWRHGCDRLDCVNPSHCRIGNRETDGRSDEDRFWDKVNKAGPTPAHRPELGSCWLWTAAIGKAGGYGSTTASGKTYFSHRRAWAFARGPVPRDLYVLHHCDNRRCVNPEHLFLGTHADNMEDMVRKNRARTGNPSKLTTEAATEILRRVKAGEQQRGLAAEFGVGESTVWRIAHGKRQFAILGVAA